MRKYLDRLLPIDGFKVVFVAFCVMLLYAVYMLCNYPIEF